MRTKDEYISYIHSDQFDVSSPNNGACFYSNDSSDNHPHHNRDRVDDLCQDHPEQYTRLENTPGGAELDKEKLFENMDRGEAREVWANASEKYAGEASGDVTTRVVGSNENSIFRTTELPTLLENEKVESINGINREDLQELYDQDPEAAFNKVCEAELERDRTAAQESGDSEALNDVSNREQLYQRQLESQGRTLETATEPRQSQEEKPEVSETAETVDVLAHEEVQQEAVEEAPAPENLDQPEELDEPEEMAEEAPQVADEPEAQEVSEDQDWKHDLGEGIADRNQAETPETQAQGEEATQTPAPPEATEESAAAPSWQSDLGEGIAHRETPATSESSALSESASASAESESMSM